MCLSCKPVISLSKWAIYFKKYKDDYLCRHPNWHLHSFIPCLCLFLCTVMKGRGELCTKCISISQSGTILRTTLEYCKSSLLPSHPCVECIGLYSTAKRRHLWSNRKEILTNVIQCIQTLLAERRGELGIGLSNNARYFKPHHMMLAYN